MSIVIVWGSAICVLIYVLVAIYGYVTFVGTDQEEVLSETQNLFALDYQGNPLFLICFVSLLVAVIFSTPLNILPCKDSIEQLLYSENGMSKKDNIFVTFICCLACYLPAVLIP